LVDLVVVTRVSSKSIYVSAVSNVGCKTLSRCAVKEAISFSAEVILSRIGFSIASWSPCFSAKNYL
jgi:hypothetical protein